MPRISKKTIDEVFANTSMLALAQDYTSMTRAGSQWKGLSPFTAEKTPSFFVNEDKNCYYCYSTAQGGGPINFVMKLENLSFPEAVERLARRFGVTVEYEQTGSDGNPSIFKSLLELHAFAVSYFSEAFKAQNPEAQAVRDYWETRRRFSPEVAYDFSIGYLPRGGSRDFLKALTKKGFKEDVILKSGFFGNIANAKPLPLLERHVQFEARLIIPIHDMLNRVIAFTARQIPGITPDVAWEEAKYKNSAETEIFKKSRTLFNLNRAKLEYQIAQKKVGADDRALRERELKRQPFVIVEGQLDAIRCYVNGMKTAVAGQGTSITQEHMALLARYSTRLDCLLDADAAGQKAALRLMPLAFKAGLEICFLSVPGGKDPDEFLASRGPDGVREILETRVPATSLLARRFEDASLSDVERQHLFEDCFEIISAMDSVVSREEAVNDLARRVGVMPQALLQDFRRFVSKKAAELSMRDGVPVRADSEEKTAALENLQAMSAEADILLVLLKLHEPLVLAPFVDGTFPMDSVDTSLCAGSILNRIILRASDGEDMRNCSIDSLAENDEESSFLSQLFMREFESDSENASELAQKALRRFCKDYCFKENKRIRGAFANLAPGDREKFKRLSDALRRIQELEKQF
ncbi:MAG: DNA primase [Opitutales bacterium]|nr:DNA primase [Opitutales bacterium]